MRKFKRVETYDPCALFVDDKVFKAIMLNFSRMGAMITTEFMLSPKKYISIMYQNEKNEMIRMLTYVVHSKGSDHKYVSGLQFVGLEKDRRKKPR